MYEITFTKEVVRSLQKMQWNVAMLIREKLEAIAVNTNAAYSNTKKLQGREGHRLRVGDWRVLYEIQGDKLVMLVLKVAPRSEVHR